MCYFLHSIGTGMHEKRILPSTILLAKAKDAKAAETPKAMLIFWFACAGAGSSYAVGAQGGSNTVTLTESQMPSHAHSGTTVTCWP